MEKNDNLNVSSLFDEGLEIFDKINESVEPNNSSITQSQIKKAIELFEETTKIVSLVGMFSTNETIEEVATSDVKFFLLPALLGTLSLKLSSPNRLDILNIAEIYFKDFLKRCKDYGIIDFGVPLPSPEQKLNENSANIANLVSKRNAKIQRFKDKKELESQLSELKKQMDNVSFDDDIKRSFYLTMIKSLASGALEELESVEAEKPLVEHMEKIRKGGKTFGSDGEEKEKHKRPACKPLMPIIITKDEIQKKIYGAGYPSLPTMTVQEFYDQRARQGDFPDPDAPKAAELPAWSVEEAAACKVSNEEEEEERKEEGDDPERLAGKRAMDDYKDTHRRGWGNRMNRS